MMRGLFLLAAVVMISAAEPRTAVAQRGALPPSPADEVVAERIRTRIEAPPAPPSAGTRLYQVVPLRLLYVRRSFRPAWTTEQGPNRLADDLVDALGRADLEGLRPEDYHLDTIKTLLASVRADASGGKATPVDRLAELDLLLTDAFLLYGSHLLSGRVDPETLHPRWEADPRGADLATVLEDALASRNVARALQKLVPTHEGYRRVREALARERAVAASGGWPVVPDGPALKRGQRGAAVALLRERLRVEDDLEEDEPEDAELFDDALDQAVRRFQRRHGLEVDGAVSTATRASLNVSATARAEQLRLNLERWRWLPHDLGRRRILVNIAAYDLQVVEDDEVVMSMRVVVGRPYRRTPVFSDLVRYIVLNPTWNVPRNIAVHDLLPKIQEDPSYIERFGMQVFEGSAPVDPATIDWSALTAENFKYRLNQEPGQLNALGRIKFMFPNQYDVYLHDTPSRDLFDQARRDFSSGCIRVEHPIELAAYLMKKDKGWNREAIERALDQGTERTLYLSRPTPIHLLYWTAWADEDGTIQFRTDINDLDRPLARALDAPIED